MASVDFLRSLRPWTTGPEPDRDEHWSERGLCAQIGANAEFDPWYPEKGGSSLDAKRACMACPVRHECLEYALDAGEEFGIWGGMSEGERRLIRRQRRAGERAA